MLPNIIQILSAAAIASLELDLKPFELGVTNKSPEYLDKFAMGKIPAFESNDGFSLIEGASIARYGQCLHSLYRTALTVRHLVISCVSSTRVWPAWRQRQRCSSD